VHVEVDYARPARFGDRLEIGVRVERLGRSSVEIALAARRAGTGEHLCAGRFVIVSFDRRVGQAVPIPERVREAIAAYEGLAG
ncbi:MAG: thioesterase family protein, partial [Thermomicrobiaceae bacterium]|nr:thioesterase family protein [Thermomicrobiaceae bacterium]